MQSKASTVSEYLKELPPDRRQAIQAIRKEVKANLPKGYKEGMQYGMIGYFVPHSIYPDGYHCDPTQPLPYAHVASQKNHMAIYLFGMYSDPKVAEWFVREWKKTGMKLDMGKSCIRFKRIEDVPLELIGKVIAKMPVKKMIQLYEKAIADNMSRKAAKGSTKKTAKRKVASAKSATKKKAAKRRIVKKK